MNVGIDIGNETHYVKAFDWRSYENIRKLLELSNFGVAFQMFRVQVEEWKEEHSIDVAIPGMELTGHQWLVLGRLP